MCHHIIGGSKSRQIFIEFSYSFKEYISPVTTCYINYFIQIHTSSTHNNYSDKLHLLKKTRPDLELTRSGEGLRVRKRNRRERESKRCDADITHVDVDEFFFVLTCRKTRSLSLFLRCSSSSISFFIVNVIFQSNCCVWES